LKGKLNKTYYWGKVEEQDMKKYPSFLAWEPVRLKSFINI
jgi:hypothetical protein